MSVRDMEAAAKMLPQLFIGECWRKARNENPGVIHFVAFWHRNSQWGVVEFFKKPERNN